MSKKALLVRLDKIGDLVLTIPADQQPSLAEYQCTWIVSQGMGFVPSHAVPQRRFFELEKNWSLSNFKKLQTLLKEIEPDVTISFQAPWWVNFAFFIHGVKKRIGVLSKWHSYLFLNTGIRQKRSDAEYNELEYNHQLVHQGMGDTRTITYPYLTLAPEELSSTPLPELPSEYVVVHPGMAGSARNWTTPQYVELIEKLSEKVSVIITGTKADAPYIAPIQTAISLKSSIGETFKNVYWFNEKLHLKQLLLVLSQAKHVVAPSTGVLHLAASLGTSVTGIYSPVRVQKATRWGPKGKNAKTLTPKVDCPGHFSCLKEKCPHFDCMTLVTSQEVYENIF